MLLLAGFDALSAAGRFSRLSRGVRLTSSASHRGGEHSSFACAATSVTAYFEAIVNRYFCRNGDCKLSQTQTKLGFSIPDQ
jgi:hypothetical protein